MNRSHVAAVVAVVLLLSGRALADAVPPPPDDCPPGTEPTTSHAGPECAKPAPKDCPPGYRGVLGGACELAPCTTNADCSRGQSCREIPTCQEYRELYWDGWRWSRTDSPARSNLLAGPPQEAPEGPPPEAWVPLDTCARNGGCPAHAECRPLLLCYPEGEPPPAPPPPRPGGCGKGCSFGDSPRATWLGLAAATLGAFGWRRRFRGVNRAGAIQQRSSRRSQRTPR